MNKSLFLVLFTIKNYYFVKKSQFSKAKIFDKPKKYDQKLKKTKVELVLCII